MHATLSCTEYSLHNYFGNFEKKISMIKRKILQGFSVVYFFKKSCKLQFLEKYRKKALYSR